jgi:MFS family permease
MAIKTFESLKFSSFRLYFGSSVGEKTGSNMQMVVRSLLIYRLTGSAALLGMLALANAIPMILLSPPGGVIADRVQRKYVLLAGVTVSCLTALWVALSLSLGLLSSQRPGSWWILLAAAIIDGSVASLRGPSRQSMIADVVGLDHVMNATALDQMCNNVLLCIAPAIAGFMVDKVNFQAVYFTMAGAYLIAVIFLLFLPAIKMKTSTQSNFFSSFSSDTSKVLNYIRHEPIILSILLFTLFAVFLSHPYLNLMPIFTDDILKVGATGLGWLRSISGIGAITGSIIMASLPYKKRGSILLVSGMILGFALTCFAFSKIWGLSLGVMVIIGMWQAVQGTLSLSLLQHYTRDEYRGRVISFYGMTSGLSSFGTFFASILVGVIGIEWSVASLALLLAALATIILIFYPRLRKLD